MSWRRVSFRVRILLVALAGILPLAAAGLWLTGSAARSGEALLRQRLTAMLDEAAAGVGPNWVRLRAELLDLVEMDHVRAALEGGAPPIVVDGENAPVRARLATGVERAAVLDSEGVTVWSTVRTEPDRPAPPGPVLEVVLDAYAAGGERIGAVISDLRLLELLPQRGALAAQAGVLLGVRDPRRDAWLLPLPWDSPDVEQRRLLWGGEEWVLERRRVADPPLDLVAAAPLTPFAYPFRTAARQGAGIVLAVLVFGIAVAMGLAHQLTGSLERLATAADAVGRGALDTHVDEGGADEIGRLARAFNTMTAGLRRALAELSRRESLAAVGEFAASLAHEVRNPLTSVKVDLQLVEEALPDDSPLRELQRGALDEIDRLDRTVAGTLRLARSGMLDSRPVNLGDVLAGALRVAEPVLRECGADFRFEVAEPVVVNGDPEALRRVFLNLLLNAARALDRGGSVRVEARKAGAEAVVQVCDDGPGMPTEVAARAFEPFFSTRAEGSGLGLAIARRTVAAHGGSIDLDSAPGSGTTATVRLPLSGA